MKLLHQALVSAATTFEIVEGNLLEEPVEVCARAYLQSARTANLRKVRLCLRDQPVIDAVLKELKS